MDYLLAVPFGLIFLFSVINCAVRGAKRSLVRLVFVLAAAAGALFLTPVVSRLIVAPMVPIPKGGELLAELTGASPTLRAVVYGAVPAVCTAVLYPVVFLLLSLLVTIPVALLNRKTERKHKGAGALIGVVLGALCFSLAFAPLCAAVTLVEDALPEGLVDEQELTEVLEFYGVPLDVGKILGSDRVLRAEAVPGRPLLDCLTTIRENGKQLSLSEELRGLLPLVKELAAADLSDLSDLSVISPLLDSVADYAEQSVLAGDVVDELQTAAREKWTAGEAFLGYDPRNPDGGVGELLACVICSNPENLTVRELLEKVNNLLVLAETFSEKPEMSEVADALDEADVSAMLEAFGVTDAAEASDVLAGMVASGALDAAEASEIMDALEASGAFDAENGQ